MRRSSLSALGKLGMSLILPLCSFGVSFPRAAVADGSSWQMQLTDGQNATEIGRDAKIDPKRSPPAAPAKVEVKADAKPAPRGVVIQRKHLSNEEQTALLAQRTSSGMMFGSFGGYASLLYAAMDVCIHAGSEEIAKTPLQSPFPEFYKPTWAELFDSIARQTRSSWSYDPKTDFWTFGRPGQPLPFTIEMARDWKADDRGSYVCYQPKVAPVGMDIYVMGNYSASNEGERQALFNKVRDDIALRFAKTFKKEMTTDGMTKTKVSNSEALYFTLAVPETGIIWRQWVIVESGKAFCIVSAIKPEQEKDILPDVEAMVKSFRIVQPPVTKPDKASEGERG